MWGPHSTHSTSHSGPTLIKARSHVGEHMRGDCKQLALEWYLPCSGERGQALRGPVWGPVPTVAGGSRTSIFFLECRLIANKREELSGQSSHVRATEGQG